MSSPARALPWLIVVGLGPGCSTGDAWSLPYLGPGDGGSIRIRDEKVDIVLDRFADSSAVEVAVYAEGELHGAERYERWERRAAVESGSPQVDHRSLPEWRARLTRLRELRREPSADAAAVIDAAVGLPFTSLVGDEIARFVGDDAARATAVLDAGSALDLDEAVAVRILALGVRAADLDDRRLADWLTLPSLRASGRAATTAMRTPVAGHATARAVLVGAGDLDSEGDEAVHRAALGLAGEAADAALIVDGVAELSGDERAAVARAVLADERCAPALALAWLAHSDDFYGSDRPPIVVAAARRAAATEHGAQVAAQQIAESLYGEDRRDAALTLLGDPQLARQLARPLLHRLDEFHGDARADVLLAIAASPACTGDLQVEVARAAVTRLRGAARERARTALASSPSLDARARAVLTR